jgi:diketogulonate reductase-like aldo/keto reductase
MTLTKAQIGRCGELLVQYQLLSRGVESAPMCTDRGVDLVAFSPLSDAPITIQVKTNLAPKPSGGKGAPLLDWWLRESSPAQLVALVDMTVPRIWLFTHSEIAECAQQKTSSGEMHFFMKLESARMRKDQRPQQVEDFNRFLLENRIDTLFGTGC